MNDLITGRAQRNITYLWLIGFFGIMLGQGLGLLKNIPNDVYTLTAVVLFFWFQRTRNTDKPDPSTTTKTEITTTTPSKEQT